MSDVHCRSLSFLLNLCSTIRRNNRVFSCVTNTARLDSRDKYSYSHQKARRLEQRMNATSAVKSTSVSSSLLLAPFQLNIWFGLFILVSGNISSIGNLLVFTSRAFRTRACSIYLIAESVVTLVCFDFVLLTRIIQKGFRLPIISRYEAICKLRQFLSEYCVEVAFTFFVLATIDRLLSTHRSIGMCRSSECSSS